jgi:sugar/nucleoside kinase (ribokinase family)
MKYEIITIGGATEDITFYTDEGILIDNHRDILRQKLLAFEYGAKIVIKNSTTFFGGGAVNTAINFSGLGFKAAAIINLGSDERGNRIFKNLKERGVATNLTAIDFSRESGYSFVVINGQGDRIIFPYRGANHGLHLNHSQIKALKTARWIYISSLSGKYWLGDLKKIFAVSGPRIIWNPGHDQLRLGVKGLASFLKQTDILCLNKDEAIELAVSDSRYKKRGNRYLNNVRNLLKIISAFGPQIVMITSGRQGADVYSGLKYYHADIVKAKKNLDTTGVGDVFNSTFLVGLEKYKGSIERALHLASLAAAKKIGYLGAQNGFLTKNDL